MATNQRLEETISTWLEESAPTRMPGRVLEATFERTRKSQQEARWRAALGRHHMARFVPALGGGLVVALAAVLALNLIPQSGPGGPRPSPSASLGVDGSLPVGPFQLWDGQGAAAKITVTIPSAGWFGTAADGTLITPNAGPEADAAGIILYAETNQLFAGSGDVYIYGDACRWSTTKPAAPVTTVAQTVAALAGQTSRVASTPMDITVAGHAGKAITLRVAPGVQPAGCDDGELRMLIEGDRARSTSAARTVDDLWIVDTGDPSGLVIFDLVYDDQIRPDVVNELRSIVESATFR